MNRERLEKIIVKISAYQPVTLLIHGMGRSPRAWWPIRSVLHRYGLSSATFGYRVAHESFDQIVTRLVAEIEHLAQQGPYVLVGHSLGGVLMRAALARLPTGVRLPQHVVLLGSPVRPAQLAQRLGGIGAFRALTGDSGQLLASPERMAEIPAPPVPSTVFIGVSGPRGRWYPLGNQPNDGVVSVTEVEPFWPAQREEVDILHTFLLSSPQIGRRLVELIRGA